jgi:hypothetical protein
MRQKTHKSERPTVNRRSSPESAEAAVAQTIGQSRDCRLSEHRLHPAHVNHIIITIVITHIFFTNTQQAAVVNAMSQ